MKVDLRRVRPEDKATLYDRLGVKKSLNYVSQMIFDREGQIELGTSNFDLTPHGLRSIRHGTKRFLPSMEEHGFSASKWDELEMVTIRLLVLTGLAARLPPAPDGGGELSHLYHLDWAPKARLTAGSLIVISKVGGSLGVKRNLNGQLEEELRIDSPLSITESNEQKLIVWIQRVMEILSIGGVTLDKNFDESEHLLRFRVLEVEAI
ncbi:hypothetical protein IT411_00640 [Candidatus Peregrinibacteria bacterium]|nr:hypothetical protein [Candidatus Peregrinibacteria bacterium]